MKKIYVFLLLCLAASALFAQDAGTQAYQKALRLVKTQEFEAALHQFDIAIGADPKNPVYHYEKGRCYLNLKDYTNARRSFSEAAEADGKNARSYVMLAYLNGMENKPDAAIEAYEKAFAREDTTNNKVRYKLEIVNLLDKNNRPQEALKHLADARALTTQHPMLLYYDGKINNRLGNYSNARESLLHCIELLTAALKKGTTQAAVNDKFTADIRRPEDMAMFYYELFYSYYQLGQYGEAKKIANRVNYPPYRDLLQEMTPAYLYEQAYAYFRVYEFEQSKALLDKVILMEKGYSPAHDLLTRIAKTRIDPVPAIRGLESFIANEKEPEKKDSLYYRLLKLEVETGRYREALATAETYLQLRSNNVDALFLKAVALGKTGGYAEAVKILRSLAISPDVGAKQNSEVNFLTGLLARRQKDDALAREAFGRISYYFFKNAAREELKKINVPRQ